ncbi:MAG TPA: DUF6452 family protein [Chryseolinea sp.]|nr:DUF6452 family protein [Chryseolinea sp.]
MKKLTWFVFYSIISVSCLDQPDCYQLNNNLIILNFKILGGSSDAYGIVGITATDTDVVFYQQGPDTVLLTTNAELPLNPLKDDIDFRFYGPEGIDTLGLTYNKQVQFVSADCGERYIFSSMLVSSHTFDSVRVVNSTPGIPPSSNIDIYRCPRTDLIRIEFNTAVTVTSVVADYKGVVYENVGDPQGTFDLPVNLLDTATMFTFNFKDGTNKRFTTTYKSTAETHFELCGEQRFISDLAINTSTTDFQATVVDNTTHDLPVKNFEVTP